MKSQSKKKNNKILKIVFLNPYISILIVVKDLIELFINVTKSFLNSNNDTMPYNPFYLIVNFIVAIFFFFIIKYLNKNYLKLEESKEIIDSMKEDLIIHEAILSIKTKILVQDNLSIVSFTNNLQKDIFFNEKLKQHYFKERTMLKDYLYNSFSEKTVDEIEKMLNYYYPINCNELNSDNNANS